MVKRNLAEIRSDCEAFFYCFIYVIHTFCKSVLYLLVLLHQLVLPHSCCCSTFSFYHCLLPNTIPILNATLFFDKLVSKDFSLLLSNPVCFHLFFLGVLELFPLPLSNSQLASQPPSQSLTQPASQTAS